MWFSVITLFPEMFEAITESGIVSRAFKNNHASIEILNPRQFVNDTHKKVDDRPFGGGAGMVMQAPVLAEVIKHAQAQAAKKGLKNVPVVYMSPQGKTLSEGNVLDMLQFDGMILLCGRYDGIDERLIQNYVDFECSIGDYVLSGGELPAMVLMDSLIRRLPNVLGDDRSAVADSFVDGLLDYPQYAKPDVFEGLGIPEVLKSGHHKNIEKWRFLQQYKRTQQKRPDLIESFELSKEQQKWLDSIANE